jgi:hypothetical protein
MNAHRVYNRQFGKRAKAAGIKYRTDEVIDHLYKGDARRGRAGHSGAMDRVTAPTDTDFDDYTLVAEPSPTGPSRPSLSDRIKNIVVPGAQDDYVDADDAPEYIHPIDPDPQPNDEEWSEIPDEEFIITAAGMKKIEENMGTYLSIVGMTSEMIDPYCGAILAENFDNIVQKWSKLVVHYPKAAQLFLDGKGGVVFAWIAAIQATWPVLYALFEHHFAHTVQVQNGIVYRKNQSQPDSRFDSTAPPMQDQFQYTAQ